MSFKSKAQQRFMYSQKPKLAKEFEKKTKDFKSLPEKAEGGNLGIPDGADGSASDGALFKEDMPRRLSTADVFKNANINPKNMKGLGLETSAEEDTLMGRLAKRMASRDLIDSLDLGTKQSKTAKEVSEDSKQSLQAKEISNDEIPSKLSISGVSAKDLKVGEKIEHEHDNTVKKLLSGKAKATDAPKLIRNDHLKEFKDYYDDKKGLPKMERTLEKAENNGFGRHFQIKDKKATNFSDPIPDKLVLSGNNMAQQARKAGKVFGKGWNIIGDLY